MLGTITLRAGSSIGVPPAAITLTPVTLFVGPNNSGKSKLLDELQALSAGGNVVNAAVLANGTLQSKSQAEITRLIDSLSTAARDEGAVPAGHVLVDARGARTHVPIDQLTAALLNPSTDQTRAQVCSWYLRHRILKLDATGRLGLINEGPAGELLREGTTPIQILFRRDELRASLRDKIYEAFGLYFVIDPTNIPNLRIRMSVAPPPSSDVERGWTQASVAFHRAAPEIQRFSDGIKAFTGILMGVTAGDPEVILLDEPEAFLHPALAFTLAKDVATVVQGTTKRVFAATHSADFVMGCIQSGTPMNIVRLTYRDGTATSRVLPSDKLLRLMRNPLLRSTGVLDGLFYESVVVGEADADRSFYREINERLVEHTDSGVPNALFLNAQNRQTVHHIIRPLRELGIPAAAIVDIDVVKEGGEVFARLLEAAFVPGITRDALAVARGRIHREFEATGRDPVLHGGVSLLQGEARAAAEQFFADLSRYGIFVVQGGALENWLPTLGAGVPKYLWLSTVFERMGEDPATAGYLLPGGDDVWAFMRRIAQWLLDQNRAGIPA